MQPQILNLLLEQDDVSWKSIIYKLVETEQMDPWDLDVTLLTQKYVKVIREMQEQDFRISGKILLAAAFLLKIKAAYLVEHDLSNLDLLLNQTDGLVDEEEVFGDLNGQKEKPPFTLIPRHPQPRSRKVSVQDLIKALEQALATKKRILAQQRPVKFEVPTKKMDILGVIRDLYHKIVYYTEKEQEDKLPFSKLLPPRAGKTEKAYTFIPLLHLESQQKVETEQEKHFEEIYVKLLKKKALSASS